MYHYTDEQLESMKKVEASRASRIEKLHQRMTAEEKDAISHRGKSVRKLADMFGENN